MNCPNCGGAIQLGATRCVKCGSVVAPGHPIVQQPVIQPAGPLQSVPARGPQALPAYTTAPKSRILARVLTLIPITGLLGIHNLYLGYSGKGIAQLLLTILSCGYGSLITWPWSLIEGIMILVGGIAKDGKGRQLVD